MPIVTVQVTYPGASPEIMESQVAQPVEDVLSGIEGLDFVTSISRAENTQITAQFRLGRSADEAANDVRDRLGRVRNLPARRGGRTHRAEGRGRCPAGDVDRLP